MTVLALARLGDDTFPDTCITAYFPMREINALCVTLAELRQEVVPKPSPALHASVAKVLSPVPARLPTLPPRADSPPPSPPPLAAPAITCSPHDQRSAGVPQRLASLPSLR